MIRDFDDRRRALSIAAHALALALFLASALPGRERLAPIVSFALRTEGSASTPAQDRSLTTRYRPSRLAVGAYSGLPYNQPSDARLIAPGGTDLTVADIVWNSEPTTEPVYYGGRLFGWSQSAPFGAMVDFTHTKAISDKTLDHAATGALAGTAVPTRTQVGDLFKRLEFSHGHNILTLNGLYRLPFGTERLRPYVGAGLGVALPHTEVWVEGREKRTYQYQYAGPAVQALAGIEIKATTRLSVFIEYKLSFARYDAPLSEGETSWLGGDLMEQFRRWRRGEAPPGGRLATDLTTHQLVGGVAVALMPGR